MLAAQKNEDLNLRRSITTADITTTNHINTSTTITSRSTISQIKYYTSDEIDDMVDNATQR